MFEISEIRASDKMVSLSRVEKASGYQLGLIKRLAILDLRRFDKNNMQNANI